MGMILDTIFGFPRVPVQRSYMWDCIMPDIWNLDNLVEGATKGLGKTVSSLAGSATELLVGASVGKFCQSVSFGQYSIDDVAEQNTGAFKKFYAGKLNISNPRITFIAPVPDIISNYFHTWKKLVVDKDGFYSPSNAYKKNIHIMLYHNTGIPVNMITLQKAFPIRFPTWELSYGETDLVKYEIEFKTDDIKTGRIMDALKNVASKAGDIVGNIM